MAECTVFRFMDSLVGRKDSYRLPNQVDVFPSLVKKDDGALKRVHTPINRVIEPFFKGKLKIEEAAYMSEGTTSDCPESRRYELEILDTDTDAILYGLIYQEGKILSVIGNLPVDRIVPILRAEGAWEGIQEAVKDLYRRLIKRIQDENKKYSVWEKEREEIRKKREKTTEDIKKIRDLTNKMERSLKIVSEDDMRIQELEEDYPGIERIVK